MEPVTTTGPVAGPRPTNREVLMQSLLKDFQSPESFAVIESLVEGTSGVSLRLLDFFLCHYSLQHNVQYPLPGEPLPFHVHDEYSQMLTDYGKVLFDCFSRKQRAVLRRGDKTLQTSAGQVMVAVKGCFCVKAFPLHPCSCVQAHMVAWAIQKGVMPYVVENAAAIRQALKAHSKRARQNGGRRKNKAVIEKRHVTDKAFTMPASWHGGVRKFKMSFSLKKSEAV